MVNSGSSANLLALAVLSNPSLPGALRPGDEVIVPDLTYIASANAVTYCGATPIFADVDPVTWTLTAESVARKITSATKAVMAVHLYGHTTEMEPLLALARERGLDVIEDAAEAHGAEYNGQRVGQLGRVATFSFYGNKIITTGEGGMITTNDRELADRIRLIRGQGMDPARRYWFAIVGYNYRMTNVQAAIGLAQLERIDWFVERRREVARWYHERLVGSSLQLATEALWAKNVYWLYSVCVPEGIDRDRLMLRMAEAGIETRPFFYALHSLPPYHVPTGDDAFPVSTSLAARGINLPSSAALTEGDVSRVSRVLLACLKG
jgi:perosamine synthetase